MNTLLEQIKTHRSIRKYKSDMLPKEIIEQIVEAGTFAPTGMNNQTPIIVAVTNKDVRDRLSAANAKIGGWKEGFDPFYGAPVVLIVLADKNSLHRVYDGSLVMENLMLAAHALNVGSCWIHRAKQEFEMPEWQEWLKSLGVKGEYEGIGHCILGYVDGDYPEAKPRKKDWMFYVE